MDEFLFLKEENPNIKLSIEHQDKDIKDFLFEHFDFYIVKEDLVKSIMSIRVNR